MCPNWLRRPCWLSEDWLSEGCVLLLLFFLGFFSFRLFCLSTIVRFFVSTTVRPSIFLLEMAKAARLDVDTLFPTSLTAHALLQPGRY